MKYLFQPNQYSQQRQYQKKVWIYPVMLAMYATYLRNQGHEVVWDSSTFFTDGKIIITSESQIDIPFLDLPHPDRKFTYALDSKYQSNGNFKYLPGTYIMASDSCWYRRCKFCVETKKTISSTRSVKDVISEITECVDAGYKEIFDDSGTFPINEWLMAFCENMITSGLNKKVRISCNMRLDFNHPNLAGMKDLRRAGFRMILYGLESANQATLDKLNKGINISTAIDNIKRCAKVGLEPHIAFMVSYPWETEKETLNTINLVKWLLRKGYAKTAQCSFYTPPKGQPQGNEEYRKYVNKFYEVGYDPRFWFRKIIDLRSITDLRYLARSIQKGWEGLCIQKNGI